MKKESVDMKYLKAVWEFCWYVFAPQRRPKDYYKL